MPYALQQPFTYGDYLRWPEEERRKPSDGHPFAMSLAPSPRHQEIAGELFRQEGKPEPAVLPGLTTDLEQVFAERE